MFTNFDSVSGPALQRRLLGMDALLRQKRSVVKLGFWKSYFPSQEQGRPGGLEPSSTRVELTRDPETTQT